MVDLFFAVLTDEFEVEIMAAFVLVVDSEELGFVGVDEFGGVVVVHLLQSGLVDWGVVVVIVNLVKFVGETGGGTNSMKSTG